MFQENEVVMLILGFGVLLFIFLNGVHIKRIYSWKILIGGYYFMLTGWFFTILEGFLFEFYINLLEHICYAISTVLITVWCWKSTRRSGKEAVK